MSRTSRLETLNTFFGEDHVSGTQAKRSFVWPVHLGCEHFFIIIIIMIIIIIVIEWLMCGQRATLQRSAPAA